MTTPTVEPPLDLPYEGAPMRAAFRRFWKKGFTATGRASLAEYWKAWLATTATVAALYILSSIVSAAGLAAVMNSGNYSSYTTVTAISGFLVVVALLYAIAVAIPSITLAVRRLHDTNQSGAMYFLAFIPFLGGLILLFLLAQPSRPEGARFDLAPSLRPEDPPAPPVRSSSYGEIPAPPSAAPPFSGTAPLASAQPAPPVPPRSAVPPVPPVAVVAHSASAPPLPRVPVPPAPVAFAGGPAPVAPIPGIPGIPSSPVEAPPRMPAPDLEGTRVASSLSRSGWTLDLPDGRSLPVDSAVSFGRDPVSEHGGVLAPVDDPARSMSKTHARFDFAGDAVTVTDLHSTNGTRVEAPGVAAVSVAPGLPAVVRAGATVYLGDYPIRLRRA